MSAYKPIFSDHFISQLTYKTPFFLFNKKVAGEVVAHYKRLFPKNTKLFYPMKANSELPLLEVLFASGCGFELSSPYELELLQGLGVPPERMIVGNPVKSVSDIQRFRDYGIDVYVFDSEVELKKLSKHAPGSKVYVRVLVDDKANSVFTMSEKFGTHLGDAYELLKKAKGYGLVPHGISFNVGSQARNAEAWANGIRQIMPLVAALRAHGMDLQFINLGGGFPWQYHEDDKVPGLEEISQQTKRALEIVPRDMEVYLEPGRGLSAHPFVLVASVIAKITRFNGNWLYLDAGSYNALLETMPYQGFMRYRVSWTKTYDKPKRENYILTGPTCDSLDVITKEIALPAAIEEGDRLIIHDTGAYSFALATKFNGYPTPELHVLEG
jgi:ornithine decarboxylase